MKHVLNEYFDKIYCVTVADFHDRHQLVREQLRGIDFEWVFSPPARYVTPLNKLSPSEVSLVLGTVSCIDNAKINGYERIAIWEDDGVIAATEEQMRSFFKELPEGWDCLYMGNASWTSVMKWLRTTPLSPHVNRVEWGTGSSFNAIQARAFDWVKDISLRFDCPLDFSYYQVFAKGNSYAPAKGFFSDPVSSIDPRPYNPKPPEGKVFLPSRIVHGA